MPLVVASPLAFPREESVVLDNANRVGVGINYDDGSQPGDPNNSHDPGCCYRDAVASWPLGQIPPRVSAVSPSHSTSADSLGDQALDAPQLVLGRSAITALWVQGNPGSESPTSGHLEQAYGPFGAGMQTTALSGYFSDTENSNGVNTLALTRTPSGLPEAGWQAAPDLLEATTGAPTGRLHRAGSRVVVRELTHQAISPGEMRTDGLGDMLFIYQRPHSGTVLLSPRAPGRAFSQPRPIGSAGSNPVLVAGGHRRAVLGWSQPLSTRNFTPHVLIERGSTFGRWSRPQDLGAGDYPALTIDRRGVALLIYTRPVTRSGRRTAVFAAKAPLGSAFAAPRQLTSAHANCDTSSAATSLSDTSSAATSLSASPNGNTLIIVSCGAHGDRYRLMRLAP